MEPEHNNFTQMYRVYSKIIMFWFHASLEYKIITSSVGFNWSLPNVMNKWNRT